jgi:hypothetical protein
VLSLCFLILFTVGCVGIKVDFTKLAARNKASKIPLNLALVLAPGLGRTTEMGKSFVNPIDQYCRSVTEQAFQKVRVCKDASEAVDTADAILTPRVIKIRYTMPTSGWDDSTIQIVMEWTLKDRGNKDILWMTTIDGSAKHPFVGAVPFENSFKVLVNKGFEDLYTKTLRALQTAPEIRTLAK